MMKMHVAERQGLRVVVTLLVCLGILTGLCTYTRVFLRPTAESELSVGPFHFIGPDPTQPNPPNNQSINQSRLMNM